MRTRSAIHLRCLAVVALFLTIATGCSRKTGPDSQSGSGGEGAGPIDLVLPEQQKRNPVPLDPKIKEAWDKVGATATWFGQGADQRYLTSFSPDGLLDGMVYFWFPSPKGEIRWDQLPDPKVPFGVELGRSATTDTTIDQLKGFKTLEAVSLNGTQVTDKGFEALTEFKGIIHLSLSLKYISAAGLKNLKRFPALRSLSLWGSEVTDEVLAEVARVPGLIDLDLGATAITDEGLKHLTGLKRLRSINLSDTNVTGSGLKYLPQITALTVGSRGEPPFLPANLALLKELKTLTLWGAIQPRSLPELKTVTRLDLGSLSDDEDFKKLLQLPSLTWLKIGVSEGAGAGLAHLKGLAHLTELRLEGQINDDDVKAFRDMRHLRRLSLHGGFKMTDAGLENFSGLSELEELSLSHTPVTDEGMKHIGKLKSLRKLLLSFTKVTPQSWDQLAKLEHLTEFVIGYSTPPVSDKGLEKVKQLKHLTSLIFGGAFMTDAGLEQFKEMKNLKHLRVEGRFTDEALAKLRAALPNCEVEK